MSAEINQCADNKSTNVNGTITITSPNENIICTCYKVLSSGKMRVTKSSPKYALFGVSNGASSFWGEPTTFLGWYADREQITKEVAEIQNAIASGILTYTLKYSVKTTRRLTKIKINED